MEHIQECKYMERTPAKPMHEESAKEDIPNENSLCLGSVSVDIL